MKKFDKLLTQFLEAREVQYGPEVDDIDYTKFSAGGGQYMAKSMSSMDRTELPEYNYKMTEIAILASFSQHKPLLIWGDSGIGKSQMIKNMCRKYAAPEDGRVFKEWNKIDRRKYVEDEELQKNAYVLIDLRGTQLEAIDIRGVEMPESGTPYMNPKIPIWAHYMSLPHTQGCLFLDEINQSQTEVLNALFGVILDRVAGEVAFNEHWAIIAASNLGDDTHETTQNLPVALTQRFDTIYLVADFKQWKDWALSPRSEDEPAPPSEKIYLKAHPDMPSVDPMIVAFAESKPSYFMYEVKPGMDQSLPNMRNLELLSDKIREIKYYYLHPEQKTPRVGAYITGDIYLDIAQAARNACGVTWANSFVQFLRVYSKLDWDEMAKESAKEKYKPKNIGDLYAYVQFIANKMIKMLGKGSEYDKKIEAVWAKEEAAGGQITISDWDFAFKIVEQFVQIVRFLIYQSDDMQTTEKATATSEDPTVKAMEQQIESSMGGHAEHVASLIHSLNKIDKTVMANVLAVMHRYVETHQNNDVFLKMYEVIKDVQDIASLEK